MRESSSNLVPSNSQKLNKIQGGDKKFMKKSLSLILALAMVFTMFASVAFAADAPAATPAATPPVTAATYTPQQAFDALKAAGIVEGDAVKGANLDANMTRAEFAKVIAKLWELPENAAGSTVYTDLAGASWAAGYIGAATKAGLLNGVGGNKFNPSGNVKVEEIAKVIATGFKLPAVAYAGTGKVSTWAKGFVGAVIAAKILDESADFTKAAKRSELFTVGIKGFVLYQDSKKPTPTPVPTSKVFDLSSVAALNSKVIEVSLGTAAVAGDLNVANVSVKDAAGAVVAVASVIAAPYATDGKTVLVTLGADTKAGTLYTLTSGTKTLNFGGKAVDTDKPTITKVVGTDAYEVTVTFSEAVKLDAAKFVLAEKYGSKTALEAKSFKYTAADTVVITTADQKNATLYGADISGVADFAGNTMDSDTAQTFNGIAASTADLKIIFAGSNNPDEVVVQSDVNLDPATLVAANFKVEESYGTKAVLTVTAARLATTDDKNTVGAALVAGSADSTNPKKFAIVSVTGLKASTLYKVTATGLKTLYGKGQDSSANSATFTGTPIPTDALIYTVTGGIASSNTQVTIVYAYKADKATAENVANYAIAEAYGAKAAVAVTKAALQSDGKTVKLTVAALSQVLYKLTVTNVKDIYGNAIKTADSANAVSFSGIAIADKITAIDSIAYDGTSETVIIVDFNRNVGTNAADVSLYSINNSVGYPSRAATVSDHADQVKLTIPKTNTGDIYTLTVKGLLNADGVNMDSAGITSTFVGKGITLGALKLQGVFATDNQTLKIYFDRDVTKDSIKGKVWASSTANTLSAGALTYDNGTTTGIALTGLAYQDAVDKNALVVRTSGTPFKTGTFKLNGVNANGAVFNTDNKTLVFSPKTDDAAQIAAENVQMLNKSTLRVYFNQPVYGSLNGFANILVNGTGATVGLTNATAIDSSKKAYDFLVTIPTTSITKLELQVLDAPIASTVITDDVRGTGSFVAVKNESTGRSGYSQVRQFSYNSSEPADLKDIAVIAIDEKTIKVIYPTLMNQSQVENRANYSFVDGSSTPVSLILNSGLTQIKYDSADNSATIILNAKLNTSSNGSYLLFTNINVSNAVGTQFVKDGTTPIKKQVSPSTTASAKVTVTSATYAGYVAAPTITIKLNQKSLSATNITNGATALGVVDVTYKNFVSGVLTSFTLQATDIASVATNNDGVAVVGGNTTTGYFDTIVITLNSALNSNIAAGQTGKVQIKAGLTGINGNASDTDSTTTFAQN